MNCEQKNHFVVAVAVMLNNFCFADLFKLQLYKITLINSQNGKHIYDIDIE